MKGLQAVQPDAVPRKAESFFGQKIRKCVLCGHSGLCEYSSSDNGPICFDGIRCVGRWFHKYDNGQQKVSK